ncbi:MAG: S28 family serine protease [Candidatus Cryptobacteroides sp.]
MKRADLMKLLLIAATISVMFSSCRQDEQPIPEPGEEPQAIEEFLQSIPQVFSVEKLEDDWAGFESAWQMTFKQPLDHFDKSVGYSIPQRVYLHFKSYDAPVVLYGTGYQIYDFVPDIARLLDANVIEFEYRYFEKSIPDGMYPDVNWTYLTSRQASADLHDIYEAFKPAFWNKWVSSGVSKGGITSALYARFYPDDMDLYLPFCAPFCTSLDDEGIGKWISEGIATQEVRDGMIKFIKMALRMQEELCEEAANRDEFKAMSLEDIAAQMPGNIINTFFDRLAYKPVSDWFPMIPDENSSVAEIYDFISAAEQSVEERRRDMKVRLFTKSGEEEPLISDNAYEPQALRELGYFIFDLTPYREEVEENLISDDDVRFADNLGTASERETIVFSDTLMVNFLGKFLPKTNSKMIFVYGQDDFWTGAGIKDNCGNPNIGRFVIKDSNHTDDFLAYPHNEDTEALSAAINKALGL